jgi:hypothetical protein
MQKNMVKNLFHLGIVNRAHETTNLIAHGLGGDTSSSRFEIDMARTSHTRVERVGSGQGQGQETHVARRRRMSWPERQRWKGAYWI